jgi:uncharacterized LabA/DUF88 family protein
MESMLMIDGGFFKKKFKTTYKRPVSVEETVEFASNLMESLGFKKASYRTYYYDCPPNNETTKLPVSKDSYNFGDSPGYKKMYQFIQDLKRQDFFAVREGVLVFKGWNLKPKVTKEPKLGNITDDSFTPFLQQKGVDTKIGLDIAWASYEKITQNIVLVTGDSDFAPAMKTARRNGVFVYLYTLGHGVMSQILDNADMLNTSSIRNFIN